MTSPLVSDDVHDRVGDWVRLVDGLYPEHEAAGWDATGLQVGDPAAPVGTVLVCLDVTDATLAEAAMAGADLILAHHPLLFRPIERLTPAVPAARLALRAAEQGVAVLAAHTNFDVAVGGTTDPIVELLDLRDVRPLEALRPGDATVKLVTFCPTDATAPVLAAVSEAGAGVIGEYDMCSFRVAGTGTFRPSATANPAIGERRQLNEVAEDRLEVVVPRARLAAVVDALTESHPYEEVAYDIYPLVSPPPPGKGIGRVGDLPEPTALGDLARRIETGLPAPFLRAAGSLGRTVRRVAACGGAGDSYIAAAHAAGADVYITGDLRHHPTLDALTLGLAVIDAGHGATESAALPGLISRLSEAAAEHGLRARLVPSQVGAEPWVDHRSPAAAEAAGTQKGTQT